MIIRVRIVRFSHLHTFPTSHLLSFVICQLSSVIWPLLLALFAGLVALLVGLIVGLLLGLLVMIVQVQNGVGPKAPIKTGKG
jgi:hypothetical protein